MATLSTRQSLLLAAARIRPPKRRMMIGGEVQEPELCSYCIHKYSNNDNVYATPDCLLKNETLPALGGNFSRGIRKYLRSDRRKDSAPSKRDETEGVYLFPACCSCCKCSSCGRRNGNEEQKEDEGDDNEGGDGDGDGGDYGDDGGFFDGGHQGYSANENDYLYMISGRNKGYSRAQCLQKDVRYSLPIVGYMFRDEDEEEILQSICLSWPEGNYPIHFTGTICIVLQRSIIFVDAPFVSETLFLCNCRCGEGKAGLSLQEEMERVISFSSEGSNMINRVAFVQNIQRLFGNNRLRREPNMVVSLFCLDCVHTRAIRTAYDKNLVFDAPECPVLEKTAAKLISDKTFEFDVTVAMNIVEEQAVNEMDEEEEEDASMKYVHSLMVPRICLCGNGFYHALEELRNATVFASATPLFRFGSIISVSARMVPTCSRCERDNCRCAYVGHLDQVLLCVRPGIRQKPPKDNEIEELDVCDDSHIDYSKAIAHSYKLRSFALKPYSKEFPVIVDPFRKRCHELPQLLKPSIMCDCINGVGEDDNEPLHCFCVLRCSCGEIWNEAICTPSKKLLILHREFPVCYDVCGLRCPLGQCETVLQYEGREDGITILFCGKAGPLAGYCVGIATVWLLEIVKSLYDSYDPLTRLYDTMIHYYLVGGFNPAFSLPKSTFFYHLQAVIPRLILPAFPVEAYECFTCGPSPKVTVYDGTENGIRRKTAPTGTFNQYEGMLEVPSILDPSIIRPAAYNRPPNVPVYLLKETVNWCQLTTFAGTGAVKKQECLLRFCRAKPDVAVFTIADLDAALLLFDGPAPIDRAVCFMLDHHKSNDLVVPVRNLGPVIQGMAAKSVAPITGADGSLLVALYSLLAIGVSGSTIIPPIFHSLMSPTKFTMMEARRIVAGEGRMPVDAVQDTTNTTTIDTFFASLDACKQLWNTNAAKFAGELALKTLKSLLKMKNMRIVSDITPISISDLAASFFPQLGNFLSDLPSQIVPVWSRPLLACMGEKWLLFIGQGFRHSKPICSRVWEAEEPFETR